MTVAQHTPVPTEYQRVPMMDASMLEGRTRPPQQEPYPTWLRQQLQRRPRSEAKAVPRRARAWLRQLAGRSLT